MNTFDNWLANIYARLEDRNHPHYRFSIRQLHNLKKRLGEDPNAVADSIIDSAYEQDTNVNLVNIHNQQPKLTIKQSNEGDTMSITIRFESTTERDAWMDQAYPKRTCMNVPGLFKTPTAWLHVHWLKVQVTRRFPRKQKVSKSNGQ